MLDELSESRKLIKDLERRRVKFIVHLLLRNKEFLTKIIESKVREGEEG